MACFKFAAKLTGWLADIDIPGLDRLRKAGLE
jgi:hypothetical protein